MAAVDELAAARLHEQGKDRMRIARHEGYRSQGRSKGKADAKDGNQIVDRGSSCRGRPWTLSRSGRARGRMQCYLHIVIE